MSHDFVQKRIRVTDLLADSSGHVNFNTTGVKMRFTPATPVQVTHWGFIPDSAFTTVSAFQLGIRSEVTPGGASTLLDTLTVGASVAVANGKGYSRDAVIPVAQATGSDGSLDNVSSTKLLINPGQSLTINVETAVGAAGTGAVWMEYTEHGYIDKVGADVTGTPAESTLFIKKAS